MPPAVRNLIHEVQPEAARVLLLETRFSDLHALCFRRLLHGDRDRVLAGPHGDTDRIDSIAKTSMSHRVGDDLRNGQLHVAHPGLQLQDTKAGHAGSRYGSRFGTRDDFDLVLGEGLVFHPLPVVGTPAPST